MTQVSSNASAQVEQDQADKRGGQAAIAKVNAEKAKAGAERLRRRFRDKDPIIKMIRELNKVALTDLKKALTNEDRKAFSKSFAKVLGTMVAEVQSTGFDQDLTKGIKDACQLIENEKDLEVVAAVMGVLGTKATKDIYTTLSLKPEADQPPIYVARGKAAFRLIRTELKGLNLDAAGKAIRDDLVQKVKDDWSKPERAKEIVAEVRDCISEVQAAAVPGVKVQGDSSTLEFARVALGLYESMTQAEARLVGGGAIVSFPGDSDEDKA